MPQEFEYQGVVYTIPDGVVTDEFHLVRLPPDGRLIQMRTFPGTNLLEINAVTPVEAARKPVQPFTTDDVAAVIRKMTETLNCRVNGVDLAEYGRTLLGPRTRGSTTAKGLDEMPRTPCVDVTDVLPALVKTPGCRYFQAYVEGLGGRVGALPYKDCNPAAVKRREHIHGPELYIDRPPEACGFSETDLVTIVMGPPDEVPGFPAGIVYTWHPGCPLAPLASTDATPTDYTAVKLHNG